MRRGLNEITYHSKLDDLIHHHSISLHVRDIKI